MKLTKTELIESVKTGK